LLDKSLPFFDFIMKRPAGSPIPDYPLLDGFHVVNFQLGDELDWAKIETAVGEFTDEDLALKYFTDKFLSVLTETEKRTIFLENSGGQKVATATAWWDFKGDTKVPKLHWVAVLPEFQGLGLGKSLLTVITKRMVELDKNQDFYLHTQTWSSRAVKLYEKFGYFITDEKNIASCKNDHYLDALSVLTKLSK